MRVGAYIVTHNEAGKFLPQMLSDLILKVDGVAVYDDRSTDNTVELADRLGAVTAVRPQNIPSFCEHEGRFRQAAWDWAAQVLDLESGDWLLAIDADEWLCQAESKGSLSFREDLHRYLGNVPTHCTSVLIQKHEVFDIREGVPWVRKDGYWGRIIGTRLCRWQPGGTFANKVMGSGCEPSYAPIRPHRDAGGFYLLHYGYCTREAQIAKYERYMSFMDHGHSDSHIRSIITEPLLEEFKLPHPRIYA